MPGVQGSLANLLSTTRKLHRSHQRLAVDYLTGLISQHRLQRTLNQVTHTGAQNKCLIVLQPKWPYCRKDTTDRLPPFFAVNEPLPLLLALIMGLQHALAMTGGIVLGPIIVASTNPNPEVTQCECVVFVKLLLFCSSACYVPAAIE